MRLIILILLLSIVGCSRQSSIIDFSNKKVSGEFAAPINKNMFEPDSFLVFVNNDSTVIKKDGTTSISNLKIPLDSGFYIEKLQYFQPNNETIILQYVETDDDAGGSKIIKYSIANKKIEWIQYAGAFNMGHFLLWDGFVYVNSIGHLGKINLINGKIEWELKDLYERYRANNFVNVVVTDDYVKGTYSDGLKKVKDITVDNKTGKIYNKVK